MPFLHPCTTSLFKLAFCSISVTETDDYQTQDSTESRVDEITESPRTTREDIIHTWSLISVSNVGDIKYCSEQQDSALLEEEREK